MTQDLGDIPARANWAEEAVARPHARAPST